MDGLRCSLFGRLLSGSFLILLAFASGLSVSAAGSAGAPPAEPTPVFHAMWGTLCDTVVSGVDGCDGNFRSPRSVAVSAAGSVYVVESWNNRIQRFDSRGNFQIKWGSAGTGNGQFDEPDGVAVDATGNVYVADTFNNRIQKFDSDGSFITKWGTYGSGNTELSAPTAVTVNSVGNVYVSDWSNNRVVRFNSSGTYQAQWGAFCDTTASGVDGCDGDFYGPYGLAVDSSYNVYVADSLNHRIQKFNSTGATLLAKWGTYCDTGASGVDACDGDFENPVGVTIDADDNVYVTDYNNNRIQKFDSDGNFLSKWGTSGTDPGMLRSPAGMDVDASGHIFVAEASNSRVQKFGPPLLDLFIGAPAHSAFNTTLGSTRVARRAGT